MSIYSQSSATAFESHTKVNRVIWHRTNGRNGRTPPRPKDPLIFGLKEVPSIGLIVVGHLPCPPELKNLNLSRDRR